MTPEGRVKAAINKVLDKAGCWRFMPVPTGYGRKTVDYIVCARGVFIGIEAKRPGKVPTELQELELEKIRAAGGKTFVIDNDGDALIPLKEFLNDLASPDH